MNLTLIRRSFNRHETIGELLIDGEFFCYTLEGFRGIRVHSGNHHLHTEGCILLGMSRDAHNVLNSRKAMGLFMSKFNEPCQIQIIRG